jgi:hypothetical protein
MSLNIDDDEPPTLVDVGADGATVLANVDEDDELVPGGKVPITIVTGYLGAGSETRLSWQSQKHMLITTARLFRNYAHELHPPRTTLEADSCDSERLVVSIQSAANLSLTRMCVAQQSSEIVSFCRVTYS